MSLLQAWVCHLPYELLYGDWDGYFGYSADLLRIFAFGKRKEKEMSVVSAKDKHGTSGWGGVS